jgi:hypothetical protein
VASGEVGEVSGGGHQDGGHAEHYCLCLGPGAMRTCWDAFPISVAILGCGANPRP